jgi:hypothetical protein
VAAAAQHCHRRYILSAIAQTVTNYYRPSHARLWVRQITTVSLATDLCHQQGISREIWECSQKRQSTDFAVRGECVPESLSLKRTHNNESQPTSSVSGGEPEGKELIKNRPSGATSYRKAANVALTIRV